MLLRSFPLKFFKGFLEEFVLIWIRGEKRERKLQIQLPLQPFVRIRIFRGEKKEKKWPSWCLLPSAYFFLIVFFLFLFGFFSPRWHWQKFKKKIVQWNCSNRNIRLDPTRLIQGSKVKAIWITQGPTLRSASPR